MLYSMIAGGFSREALISFLLTLPIILIALTVHELSHGYAAYRLGDPTAYQFGRLTLDPRRHLDPIGTMMMLFFGFGWAKPVPVDTRRFRKPRRDMAITALAGPCANILLCFFFYICFRVTVAVVVPEFSVLLEDGFAVSYAASLLANFALANIGGVSAILMLFFYYAFYLNATLAVFNLIPIPPLDGSRILSALLPPRIYYKVMDYERYFALAMIFALWRGWLDVPLFYCTNGLVWLCEHAIGWLPFF